ncbi:hypothetical protein BHE74_00034912, partial [Ensete ventricosum]
MEKDPGRADYLLLPGDLLPELGGLLPDSFHPPPGRRTPEKPGIRSAICRYLQGGGGVGGGGGGGER